MKTSALLYCVSLVVDKVVGKRQIKRVAPLICVNIETTAAGKFRLRSDREVLSNHTVFRINRGREQPHEIWLRNGFKFLSKNRQHYVRSVIKFDYYCALVVTYVRNCFTIVYRSIRRSLRARRECSSQGSLLQVCSA